MPKGPRGEKRPADVNACAVMVAKIATGEVADEGYAAPGRVRSGKAGGVARGKNLAPEQKQAIARKAATRRWNNGQQGH